MPNEIYGRVSCVYDVLNHMLLDAQLAPFHDGERLLASTSIEKVENYFNGQRIYLLDRGYWQMELYSKILSMGHSLVARVRNHMTKELKCGSPTATISSDSQPFTLRVVRLFLPSGETETLVTNLSPHEFSDQDIAQLYSLRWGVETAHDGLKNLLAMNNISSKTRLTVYQDFYALLAVLIWLHLPPMLPMPKLLTSEPTSTINTSIKRYDKVWQSENCDVCANILYWRISIWTGIFLTRTTVCGLSFKATTTSLGHHRGTESCRSDGTGRQDEKYPGKCDGNRGQRNYICVSDK